MAFGAFCAERRPVVHHECAGLAQIAAEEEEEEEEEGKRLLSPVPIPARPARKWTYLS